MHSNRAILSRGAAVKQCPASNPDAEISAGTAKSADTDGTTPGAITAGPNGSREFSKEKSTSISSNRIIL